MKSTTQREAEWRVLEGTTPALKRGAWTGRDEAAGRNSQTCMGMFGDLHLVFVLESMIANVYIRGQNPSKKRSIPLSDR